MNTPTTSLSTPKRAAGSRTAPLRVGIGGPVGSGKTALTLALCQALRESIDMAVVTNDIYTAEDAKFLVNHSALAPERIEPAYLRNNVALTLEEQRALRASR